MEFDFDELLTNIGDLCDLMTIEEVAKFLRTNKDTVYKLIHAGILPFIKLGRIKVIKGDLIQMLVKYRNCDLSNPEEIIYLGTE